MSIPDLINSCFEFSAGLFLWNNVRVVIRDKKVRGYSILAVIVFSIWGYWNLFYYPHLHQWLSFFGGLNVVIPDSIWVVLALYYTKKEKR